MDANKLDFMVVFWDGRIETQSMWGGSGYGTLTLHGVLKVSLGVNGATITGDERVLRRPVPGDWVLRKGAGEAELVGALAEGVNRQLGWKIRIVRAPMQREVFVARGEFSLKPILPQPQPNSPRILVSDMGNAGGGGTGSGARFLSDVGKKVQEVIIDESANAASIQTIWEWDGYKRNQANAGGMPEGPKKEQVLDGLLENVAEQTGLTFTREQRTVEVWRVTEDR